MISIRKLFSSPLFQVVEDFLELRVVQAADILEQIVRLGDELHVAVLDAVVNHLDEMPRPAVAAVGDAGHAVVGLGGDLLQDRLQVLVRFLVAAGHQAGAPQRAFFAAADAHAEKSNPRRPKLLLPPLGVGEMRVAAVDHDVARLEKRLELVNDHIHRLAGLDHDQNPPGLSEGGAGDSCGVLAPLTTFSPWPAD